MANVAGVEWQNIVALELYYHRICYQQFTRPNRLRGGFFKIQTEIIDLLHEYVQTHVIDNFEVVHTNELIDLYRENCNDEMEVPDKRTLVDLIIKEFGEKIALWSPKHGSSFMFNDEIPKGQVIEILTKKILMLQEKEKKQPIEDKIEEVARSIRNEIISAPLTFEQWPPSEEAILEKNTEIPTSLLHLLTSVLSCSTSRVSKRKERFIRSLCQDIIYNSTNGRHRTSKHVLFSLCVKRKTGSKDMVKWLNKFGHGISYDEVNVVETFLADEAVKYQAVKSFCPSSIQPSVFVTFVWDNNDINPESLSGISMHCTNGIVIQLQEIQNYTPIAISLREKPERKRVFKALPNTLTHYISRKRVDPTHLASLNVDYSEDESFNTSTIMDFLWVLLRQSSSSIPNWSGFNYLIDNDMGEKNHTITYLPAINDSPTKMDTVLELLVQSKCKAERLGLTETDIVVDQAIYAKAVEILMNPTHIDLKRFIVLRMGAFHTSCIFMAVIGKRFSDAGLRDWIIEANLLGK